MVLWVSAGEILNQTGQRFRSQEVLQTFTHALIRISVAETITATHGGGEVLIAWDLVKVEIANRRVLEAAKVLPTVEVRAGGSGARPPRGAGRGRRGHVTCCWET